MPGVTQFLSQAFTDTGSESGKIFTAFKEKSNIEELKKEYLNSLGDNEDAKKIFNEATEENQQQILFADQVASGKFSITKTENSNASDFYDIERNQSDSAISEKLKAIEVSEDELDVYTDLLKVKYNITAANEDEEQSLKALAVRQLTLNKGLENLSST